MQFLENVKSKAIQTIHKLYNDLNSGSNSTNEDVNEVLLKVYKKLSKQSDSYDPAPIIQRLVQYLYFQSVSNGCSFSEKQNSYIRELSKIGQSAGLRGIYRGDFTDKSQFD